MALLLGTGDPSHPNFSTTKQNGEALFFRLLPIELRVQVYEYALSEDQPIRVNQVANRSNKFVAYYAADSGNERKRRPMFVSSLTRVSRHIYLELKKHPVFYRVNEFKFDYWQFEKDSLCFLAAITPERRALIRNITLGVDGYDASSLIQQTNGHRTETNDYKHLLSLLGLCEDLRHLRIVVYMDLNARGSAFMFPSLLHTFINAAASDEIDPFIGRMSYIDPTIVLGFGTHFDTEPRSDLHFDLTQMGPLPESIAKLLNSTNARLLLQARDAVITLKERCKKAYPDGNKSLNNATDAQVHDAFAYARVDFPGEDRLGLDRFNSTRGTVSSRTRQKCNKESVDDCGVLRQKNQKKYDAEGLLAWRYIKIHDLRRIGDSIEVDVEEIDFEDDKRAKERSWEPIEAVMSEKWEEEVCDFYHEFIKFPVGPPFDLLFLATQLEKTRRLPTPDDVKATTPGFLVDLEEENKVPRNRRDKRWKWKYWQYLYLDYVNGLEEFAKKQELEQKEPETEKEEKEEDLQKVEKLKKGKKRKLGAVGVSNKRR
ncbi:hypothetical protein G7054_g2523 [Neopestalotiopsis clavispora]|nr:hypothetical protein G7054_g2523 [Neopestalotiopsis clavispora]